MTPNFSLFGSLINRFGVLLSTNNLLCRRKTRRKFHVYGKRQPANAKNGGKIMVSSFHVNVMLICLKAAKHEIQKPSTCRATLFRCKFWSMFRVFHLAWSTWPATKTFVAGWRNAGRWLVDLLVHEHICCATSCELDEKRATKPKFVAQSRPVLYFSQQLSSTRNKCFCCATSWSCKVKNGKHRPKLATKQCCAPSWGFLYLVFHRLNDTFECFLALWYISCLVHFLTLTRFPVLCKQAKAQATCADAVR